MPNGVKKTKQWQVINLNTQEIVGVVKWYGGWRKYVYYNSVVGYSDWDFMRLIASFCEQKTQEHYSI